MSNGVELATAYVSLAIEGSALSGQVSKALGQTEAVAAAAAEKSGKKAGGGLGAGIVAGAKSVAGPLAALFAVDKIVGFVSEGIDGARESARVNALTEQTIKATGGAAKVSAGQVADLAEALSKKTGIDDEAIQTGSNLLLTFKKIRNEAGAGNDVFNQATAAALDLSKSGFGSIDSASKMLGKALNDPVQGMSALSRAGVTFAAQQKEQVKALVATGDTLGAQKLILKEIESQVGGNAAATATATDKMQVAWGNLQEKVGAKLLPVLERLATWFTDTAIPALERFGGWLGDVFGGAIGDAGSAAIDFQGILNDLQPAVDVLGAVLGFLGDVLGDVVIPAIVAVAKVQLPLMAKSVGLVGEAGKWLWNNVFQPVFRFLVSGASKVLEMFGNMLDVLGNVPGFEWAKDAATKMHEAAGRAEELATKINKIPDTKSVLINIGARVTSSRVKVGGEYVNVGLRARGGPVRAGSPYIVGEQGPELVVPSRSGYVIPAPQTKAALASAAGQSGQAGRSYNFYGNLSGDPDEIAASIEYRARRRDVLERAYV